MFTIKQLLAFAFVAALSNAAFAYEPDTSKWKTFHSTKDGYSFSYPDSSIPGSAPENVKVQFSDGKVCVNGDCTSAGISWYDTSGAGKVTLVKFVIQRNMNPSSLPIDKLYVSMANQPLGPNDSIITIGGKSALHTANGSYFIPINTTDVLSLPCGHTDSALDKTCKAMALSLTFP